MDLKKSKFSGQKRVSRQTAVEILVEIDYKDESLKRASELEFQRIISTGKLNALLHLHIQPINLVVYQDP